MNSKRSTASILLSAPAVLSHKHSHSGAPLTRDRARQANIIGKGRGDWEALTTPMSRRAWGFAQAGHDLAMGPAPGSLSAGPDNAGPGTSTACSAGRATPSRCTKHVILSCPLWPPGLLSSDNPIIVSSKKKKNFLWNPRFHSHTCHRQKPGQDRSPVLSLGQVSQTPGPPPAGSRGSCHRYWEPPSKTRAAL